MDAWIFSSDWRARLTLIFCVACFYTGVVLINKHLLFFWAIDKSYRYWIYPPAGVRLALIMLLGWPGLLGYFIAALAIYSSNTPEITWFTDAILMAFARATSLWLGLIAYGWMTKVKTPWNRLTWGHVPFLALFVNFVSNSAASLALIFLGIENADDFGRNVAMHLIGDTIGTIIVLVIFIRLRKAYTESQLAKLEQTRDQPS